MKVEAPTGLLRSQHNTQYSLSLPSGMTWNPVVSPDGEITIPEELIEKYDIRGRVVLEEAEDHIKIKRVPDPSEFTGIAESMTNERGENALEILERGRKTDERFP